MPALVPVTLNAQLFQAANADQSHHGSRFGGVRVDRVSKECNDEEPFSTGPIPSDVQKFTLSEFWPHDHSYFRL